MSVNFAVLGPVPHEHLDAGVEVARDTGYVCFGSQNWDLFANVDNMRKGEDVPVLFYPSYEDV